jgi:hypothetical protein
MSDTTETVTLTRAEYEALIEGLEDAEDFAAVAAAEAREAVPRQGRGARKSFADRAGAPTQRRREPGARLACPSGSRPRLPSLLLPELPRAM